MSHTTRPIPKEKRRILSVYRRAAGKVYARLGPWASHRFAATIFRSNAPDCGSLIPDIDFAALLAAVRLVYANRQGTSFGRVANIIYLVGDDEIQELVRIVRSDWRSLLNRHITFDLHGDIFPPKRLLDTWLNGEEFHMEDALLHRVDAIRDAGIVPLLVLQLTARDLCYPILALDNVAAMVLDESLRPLPDAGKLLTEDESAG